MSELTGAVCAIGGKPIVGLIRHVKTVTRPEGVVLCEAHGLVYEHGDRLADALAELLGDDHPFVLLHHNALNDSLQESPCPALTFAEAVEPTPVIDDETREALDHFWEKGRTPSWERVGGED